MQIPKDGISLTKKHYQFLKGANRKIINIVGKQGELLKRFKDSEELFGCVDLSRSITYFKISLNKFLCQFPVSVLYLAILTTILS